MLSDVIRGPPESPRQALRCSSPLAQTMLLLKIRYGKDLKHDSMEIAFSLVYCRVFGRSVSLFFVIPLPMAITSNPLSADGEHAKEIGWIILLNFTGSGSLINPISLLKTQKKCRECFLEQVNVNR